MAEVMVQEDQYRELRVFSFRILYKILDENRVAVIGVVHGYRLFDPEWLK
jgi:mRNA-degrading endonuclease RelE of RelBE toxin-antitoxin system